MTTTEDAEPWPYSLSWLSHCFKKDGFNCQATSAVADISKQAGVRCSFPEAYDNLKVSVFAKGVPARGLRDRIAFLSD